MPDHRDRIMTHLLLERINRHALITLHRPDARNAYSEEMIGQLITALDDIELDPSVRAVVITGSGKAFSAGGDLKLMMAKEGMFAGGPVELRARYMQNIQRVPRRLSRFSKPLIAAINGPAIGAGLDLSLMCDLRIASTKARFGSTFVKVGLIPGDGGAYYLTRAIGLARALDLCLTGRIIDAQEALTMGLVSRILDPEHLLTAAGELAEQIADNAPVAVQLTKAAAYQSLNLSPESALQLAASFQGIAQNTPDHLEGVEAILSRRPPDFKGEH